MGYAILDQRGGDSLTATTLDGYSLIADTTVSSATTTVNFTGLNIGWGDELLLVGTHIPGANTNISLFVNNNNISTNYYFQALRAEGTSVSSERSNENRLIYGNSIWNHQFLSKIKITNNGFYTMQTEVLQGISISTMAIAKNYCTSTFTISSITSLSLTAATTNGIGTGSRFQLYKSGGGASRTWAIT